jgi:hypothetical protein
MLAYELIRRDIEIVDLYTNQHHSSEEIFNYTQCLKYSIYHGLKGKTVNKIVFVDTNNFFVVVCSMIAAWELGASLFLNDVDPKVKDLPYFKKFYDVIDVVIGPVENSKWMPTDSLHINIDDYVKQKKIINNKFNETLDQPVTQDSVCYYTTSSGTTGDPKLLSFTHYQTVTISNEIKQYLGLTSVDRPYHYKTLHHGSLFNSYALPFLNVCKTHYTGLFLGGAAKFLTTLCNHIQKFNLTHFLTPYNWIRNFNDIESVKFSVPLTLITVQGQTDSEMKDLFNRFNIKQVVNYFGCSEIGTMFISRTTLANLDQYNPNRFHDITSYIDYKILTNTVECKWKHTNDWVVLADKMYKDEDGSIWHYGREVAFTINDQTLILHDLNQLIEEEIGTSQFIAVPDYKLQLLYLAVFQENLSADRLAKLNIKIQQTFSPVFFISDVHRFDPADLLFGMKISGPLLLYLFRERKNIQ